MKSLATWFLATALTIALGASQAAAGPDFSWNGALAPGKTLSIHGISGHVTATRASGREALVTAVKHGKSTHIDEVRVEVSPGADGVTICALYPPKRHGRPATCEPGKGIEGGESVDDDVDVDFTVQVPEGVKLVAEQVNGNVEATDLAGDLDVTTVNGSIHASTSGLCQAQTVNGSIVASMGRGSWESALRFETVNGSVRLRLPHDVDAELHVESVNGSITSDFPVLTNAGFWKGGSVGGTIGKGGGQLRVETVNGSIILSRSSAEEDRRPRSTKRS